jgi:hypothetical protein
MMTRKDYIATAAILNNYLKRNNSESHPQLVAEFDELVNDFISFFENDNARFDSEKFWEACFND